VGADPVPAQLNIHLVNIPGEPVLLLARLTFPDVKSKLDISLFFRPFSMGKLDGYSPELPLQNNDSGKVYSCFRRVSFGTAAFYPLTKEQAAPKVTFSYILFQLEYGFRAFKDSYIM
jgi:hypothetical protein